MNFTYFKFLFITTIKKRPVWITWLLYLFTCVSFLIILPAVARMNTLQVWANTTMAVCQTFLGMTVALFTAVLGVHIFKDGLEEGTELIVISKPISRFKTVFTKFLSFGLFCLMVNASSLIITVFTIFLPTTEIKFYWGLIVSMFIGNLVCFGVFGSISILLTVKFAKIGVIITNIIISLIFLIYQCLTLFVFQIPIKSLSEHGVSAPSYIVCDRNTTTGEYKEYEVVDFKTDVAKQIAQVAEEERNHSKTWQDSMSYWKDVICKNDPTTILNYTDWAGQVSLTYLSVKLDEYAYRQGHRFFAISRFYTYNLTSPASPEIIEGVENKQTLPWVYTNQSTNQVLDEEGKVIFTYTLPTRYHFAGIAPLGTTRLRGYGDEIPVGFYVRSGELLSSKDVYLEPELWKKYSVPFSLMCDKIFDFNLYRNLITDSIVLNDPLAWSSAWTNNNLTLNRYYSLIWSCFTGHSAEQQYFNDPFLKDYSPEYFDIHNINDLNERFLQFKYFLYYRALQEQQTVLNNIPTESEEVFAKSEVMLSQDRLNKNYILNIKDLDNNWYVQNAGGDYEAYSIIEPKTQTINIDLMEATAYQLASNISGKYAQEEINRILLNSSLSKLRRTQAMCNGSASVNEEYLFDSLDKPTRSAQYHGKAYTISNPWTSYWETLLTPAGQNMELFFYRSTETVKYWVYAVVWGIFSIIAFAGGVIVYNKFDVK